MVSDIQRRNTEILRQVRIGRDELYVAILGLENARLVTVSLGVRPTAEQLGPALPQARGLPVPWDTAVGVSENCSESADWQPQ